jgi:hypothetical protein
MIKAAAKQSKTTFQIMLAKPRFVNPHFLPPSTIRVSRKDVSLDDDDIDTGDAQRDSQTTDSLVGQLNQIIQTSLESNLESSFEGEHSDRRKRRKIIQESPHESVGSNEPLCMSYARCKYGLMR